MFGERTPKDGLDPTIRRHQPGFHVGDGVPEGHAGPELGQLSCLTWGTVARPEDPGGAGRGGLGLLPLVIRHDLREGLGRYLRRGHSPLGAV